MHTDLDLARPRRLAQTPSSVAGSRACRVRRSRGEAAPRAGAARRASGSAAPPVAVHRVARCDPRRPVSRCRRSAGAPRPRALRVEVYRAPRAARSIRPPLRRPGPKPGPAPGRVRHHLPPAMAREICQSRASVSDTACAAASVAASTRRCATSTASMLSDSARESNARVSTTPSSRPPPRCAASWNTARHCAASFSSICHATPLNSDAGARPQFDDRGAARTQQRRQPAAKTILVHLHQPAPGFAFAPAGDQRLWYPSGFEKPIARRRRAEHTPKCGARECAEVPGRSVRPGSGPRRRTGAGRHGKGRDPRRLQPPAYGTRRRRRQLGVPGMLPRPTGHAQIRGAIILCIRPVEPRADELEAGVEECRMQVHRRSTASQRGRQANAAKYLAAAAPNLARLPGMPVRNAHLAGPGARSTRRGRRARRAARPGPPGPPVRRACRCGLYMAACVQAPGSCFDVLVALRRPAVDLHEVTAVVLRCRDYLYLHRTVFRQRQCLAQHEATERDGVVAAGPSGRRRAQARGSRWQETA